MAISLLLTSGFFIVLHANAETPQAAPKLLEAIADQTLYLDAQRAANLGEVESQRIYLRDLKLSFGESMEHDYSAYPYNKSIADAWVVENYLIVLAKAPGTAQIAVTASNDYGAMIDWFIVKVERRTNEQQQNPPQTSFDRSLTQLPISLIANNIIQLPRVSQGNARYVISPELPSGLTYDAPSKSIVGRVTQELPDHVYQWIAVTEQGEVSVQEFEFVDRVGANELMRTFSNQSNQFDLAMLTSIQALSDLSVAEVSMPRDPANRVPGRIAASRPASSANSVQSTMGQQFLHGITNAMHARFRDPSRQRESESKQGTTWWNYASTNYSALNAETPYNSREPRGIYVGFDTAVEENWTTGLSIGFGNQTSTTAPYTRDVGSTLAAAPAFASVMPYAHWRVDDVREVWGIVGLTRNYSTNDVHPSALAENGSAGMLLGAIGWRQRLGSSGNVHLATVGDAGLTMPLRAFALESPEQSLRTQMTRSLSAGLEMSYAGENLQPYVGLSGRLNNDDLAGQAGFEALGGVRFTSIPGLTVEAEGRALTTGVMSADPAWNVSFAAHLDPGHRGEGFALSVAPTYGANRRLGMSNQGFGHYYQSSADLNPTDGFENAWTMSGTFSYGMPIAGSGVITPFGQIQISTLNQTRMGVRVALNSELDRLFNLEIATVNSRFEQNALDRGVDIQLRLVF